MGDLELRPPCKELYRIGPDGTYWIRPGITPEEALYVLEALVQFAAKNYKKALECEDQHKS